MTRFRNYEALRLPLDGRAVVLTGANGSGKTNLLEAVSFLIPGRGVRRARLSEVDRLNDGVSSGPWAVSAEVLGKLGETRIGTGRDGEAEGERRLVRLDGEPARSQSALGDHFAVSWLVPSMDRLFQEGGTGRRKFLDRLVHAFDPEHASRLNKFEHAMRERNRLLKEGRGEAAWLSALEDTLANVGSAIAAARGSLVERLNRVVAQTEAPFPAAELTLDGAVDRWLEEMPALAVEDRLRAAYEATRNHGDADGPNRSDLVVRHVPKNMPASHCSTGEQKALLIGIVLAHARLQAMEEGAAPVLLLDEVAAHLDAARRQGLFDAVLALGGQAWFTGTDADVFQPLQGRAQFFDVADANVRATSHD